MFPQQAWNDVPCHAGMSSFATYVSCQKNGAVPLRFEFCSRRKFIQSSCYRSACLILKRWMRDSLIGIHPWLRTCSTKCLESLSQYLIGFRTWLLPFRSLQWINKARLKGLSGSLALDHTGPSPTAVEFCQKTFFSHWRYRNGPSPQRDKWGTPQNTRLGMGWGNEQSLEQTEFSSSLVLLYHPYHPCCRTPTFGTDSFRDMHFALLTRACSFSPLNLFSFLKEFPSWRFFRQKWFLFSRFRLNLSACSY